MCLILFAWQVHREYPLIVAANRDEFFARPTQAAHFWPDAPQLLAGRDLNAGGTWMGVTRQGRFAAITNYRDMRREHASTHSRGQRVADFLRSTESPKEWLRQDADVGARYNGYNLLLGDSRELWWSSNIDTTPRQLTPGVYGLSNHLLDSPWPKVGTGKTAMARALERLPEIQPLFDPLFDLLHDTQTYPDASLPDTGIGLEWERLLSSAFIATPIYGTRSSTVLLMQRDLGLLFDEQIWLPAAQRGDQRGLRTRFCCKTLHP